MRVTCNTIEELLENLELEQSVYQKTIRLSISRRPQNKEHTSFRVILQASTVVECPDESEYILEAGVDCGVDYEDSESEQIGTEKSEELKQKLLNFVQNKGWVVRPGVIDY